MNDPTFHLEGIIKNRDEMQDFEGPLNLILMLLSKNKIEIRDIQISVILDQYLEHIARMQELDLDVASEFVQMASHLVYIKTRTLLKSDEEEVSELELLMSSLEQLKCRDLYVGIKEITPALARASERGLLLGTKQPEPLPMKDRYHYRHESVDLLGALASIFSRSRHVPEPEPTLVMPKRIVYGVRDKSRQLLELLRTSGAKTLQEMYAICESRSEIVATFISVLELCSMGNLRVSTSETGFLVSFTGGDTETILEAIPE
jgi:segregation and condensation protein A